MQQKRIPILRSIVVVDRSTNLKYIELGLDFKKVLKICASRVYLKERLNRLRIPQLSFINPTSYYWLECEKHAGHLHARAYRDTVTSIRVLHSGSIKKCRCRVCIAQNVPVPVQKRARAFCIVRIFLEIKIEGEKRRKRKRKNGYKKKEKFSILSSLWITSWYRY